MREELRKRLIAHSSQLTVHSSQLIAGQRLPLKQKHPSRRKFCFYAIKILFHRDETKIASFARGKSDAVSRPRTDGSGRTAVGGYVRKLYLCLLNFFSRKDFCPTQTTGAAHTSQTNEFLSHTLTNLSHDRCSIAVVDILQYVIYYFLKAFCNNIFFRYSRKSNCRQLFQISIFQIRPQSREA